jgi:hypothetical protein
LKPPWNKSGNVPLIRIPTLLVFFNSHLNQLNQIGFYTYIKSFMKEN